MSILLIHGGQSEDNSSETPEWLHYADDDKGIGANGMKEEADKAGDETHGKALMKRILRFFEGFRGLPK